ncbi:MAG: di-heme oxidoredictase family protein [Pseudomonadota bacterium]
MTRVGRIRGKLLPIAGAAVSAAALLGVSGLVVASVSTTRAVQEFALPTERHDLTPKDRRRVAMVTRHATDFSEAERFERMAGGAGTSTHAADRKAFQHHASNISFEARENFYLGGSLFEKLWVSSPSSTHASDGLGPLFNARSCHRCHIRNGRGHAPEGPNDTSVSMLMRVSVPPASEADVAALADRTILRVPEPNYGAQIQDYSVPGLPAEGRIAVTWDEREVALADGETVHLRRPVVSVAHLSRGPLSSGVMTSLRVANPMLGLGLLEAIHPADIAALADPGDRDGDGISGRPSIVRDPDTGELALGRFGWKATAPTVRAQSAEAFSGDIGISTTIHTDPFGDCGINEAACRAMPTGVQPRYGPVEAPDPILELVTFYSKNIAVPARRDVSDPAILEGKALFYQAGCTACHQPKFVTSRRATNPEHRFQLVWPYTDMLLHDMGEGLSDNRPLANASGREWRTAPLWGIGLTQAVNGHMNLLHDGRARGVLEAVMWHGGEAQAARDRVAAMTKAERAALVRFVESL